MVNSTDRLGTDGSTLARLLSPSLDLPSSVRDERRTNFPFSGAKARRWTPDCDFSRRRWGRRLHTGSGSVAARARCLTNSCLNRPPIMEGWLWLVSDCKEKADMIGRLSAAFDWASQPDGPQWIYMAIHSQEIFSQSIMKIKYQPGTVTNQR